MKTTRDQRRKNRLDAKKARLRARKEAAAADFSFAVTPIRCEQCGHFGVLSAPLTEIDPVFASQIAAPAGTLSFYCPECEWHDLGTFCTDPSCCTDPHCTS